LTPSNSIFSSRSANFKERRKNPRVNCRLRATRSSQEGFFLEDEIFNISRSGFFLYSSQSLEQGHKIDLMVTLAEGGQELTLQGEVAHVEGVSEEEKRFFETPFLIKAGIYLNFVEPSQKEIFRKFIEDLFASQQIQMVPLPQTLRIRIDLDPIKDGRQIQYLHGLRQRGLFIEVSYPVSIFDHPQLRLVNPLTQERVDLYGEISQALILSFSDGESSPHEAHEDSNSRCKRFGMGIRFPTLSIPERDALDRLMLGLGLRKTEKHSKLKDLPSPSNRVFFV